MKMALDPNSQDDLLNFSLDDDNKPPPPPPPSSSSSSKEFSYTQNSDDYIHSLPVCAEEELEWLSNKDAFPAVDTCFDIISVVDPVLENSSSSSITSCCGSLHVPVRKRSSSSCRRRGRECWWWNQVMQPPSNSLPRVVGRRCQHCFADKTPQWRAGPMGRKTLCNACGVRYKSGRLVAEYRPANSPSFSNGMHSNSHRKIMEMRKKMMQVG